jgi:hypothetical protein
MLLSCDPSIVLDNAEARQESSQVRHSTAAIFLSSELPFSSDRFWRRDTNACPSPRAWHEISPYLDQALSLSIEDRRTWLESFRTQKPELAELVQKLLEEHRAAEQEQFLARFHA